MHGDPTMRFHETAIDNEARKRLIDNIERFLKSCPGTAPLVIKDHTITELVSYWTTATYNLDYIPTFIIPVRRVGACVLSARSSAPSQPDELTQQIWLRSNLLAERSSRRMQRVFVEYSNLMNDWELQISRVSSILNVGLRVEENRSSVRQFLDPLLHHHRNAYDDPINDAPILDWCEAVYREFSAAAADKQLAQNRIDKIYSSFISAERSFRVARDFFRKNFDPAGTTEWLEALPNRRAGIDF